MEKLKSIFQTLKPYLRNKFIMTGLAFFIWMMFFDNNNFISQYSSRKKLNNLKADKTYYQKEIASNTQGLEELMTNKQTLEKFAREQYLMKKPNEEIFVLVTKEE